MVFRGYGFLALVPDASCLVEVILEALHKRWGNVPEGCAFAAISFEVLEGRPPIAPIPEASRIFVPLLAKHPIIREEVRVELVGCVEAPASVL